MKYYLYVSKPKVEMLFQQMRHKSVSYKQKVDAKVFSVERTSEEQDDNIFKKLQDVEDQLRTEGSVVESAGTPDGSAAYVHDVGLWRISVLKKEWEQSEPARPWAYCLCRRVKDAVCFLLGSPSNITGQMGLGQYVRAVSPSWTVDSYLLDILGKENPEATHFDEKSVPDLLHYCSYVCPGFPEFQADVLFRRYVRFKVTDALWKTTLENWRYANVELMPRPEVIIIGSPIYAALADHE